MHKTEFIRARIEPNLIDILLPNAETARAIKEARQRKGVVVCKDEQDMFDKLAI